MTAQRPTKQEYDQLRERAMQNLAWGHRMLSILLWAEKELVALTYLHQPDDFMHCAVCKEYFPCKTAERVRTIALTFEGTAEQPPNGAEEE